MKNKNAVKLGSLGGKARAKSLSPERRSEIARKAVNVRILNALAKVEIKECEGCGNFISRKEFEAGEGACFKCWNQ